MSSRFRRENRNLDYNILHKTGKRVYKTGDKMASETETVEQNKIVEDINEFFEIYELGELDTVEDLEEGIRSVAIHSKACWGIHAELKSSMSADEYLSKHWTV